MARRATSKDKAQEVGQALRVARAREKAKSPPASVAAKGRARPALRSNAATRKPARGLRLEYIRAGDITANPANWRKHPKAQLAAIQESLKRVGWAGTLMVNETTGRLLDGHARLEVADPDLFVPVLVGRWTEAQEREILATHDPIAAMARADADRLNELLAELQVDGLSIEAGGALGDLLANLPELVPPEEGASGSGGEGENPDGSDGGGDGDDYEPSVKILLTCRDGAQQEALLDVIDRLAAGEKVAAEVIAGAFAGVETRALNA